MNNLLIFIIIQNFILLYLLSKSKVVKKWTRKGSKPWVRPLSGDKVKTILRPYDKVGKHKPVANDDQAAWNKENNQV